MLLTVFGGSGVLLYLVGLVAIPEEKPGEPVGHGGRPSGTNGQRAAAFIGGTLILIGSVTLFGRFLPAFGDLLGPLLLVTAGAAVIVLGGRR